VVSDSGGIVVGSAARVVGIVSVGLVYSSASGEPQADRRREMIRMTMAFFIVLTDNKVFL